MGKQAHLCLLLHLTISPSLAGREEGWQKMGSWVHSLTEAGYAKDAKEKGILGSDGMKLKKEEGAIGMQAIWLAQAGYSVSDGVQTNKKGSEVPDSQGRNILEDRVGESFRGFQPSRIHSLTESGFAAGGRGEGVEGRGIELLQMEGVFQPSRPDQNNADERTRESSKLKHNSFLATRYYPRQEAAQPKAGIKYVKQQKKQQKQQQKQQQKKPKYLLADAANHTYLKLPMEELLRRLKDNKQLLREKIMHR